MPSLTIINQKPVKKNSFETSLNSSNTSQSSVIDVTSTDMSSVEIRQTTVKANILAKKKTNRAKKIRRSSKITKARPKERVIQDVLDIIHQWRNLYHHERHVLKRKTSLAKAAASIGYSKKSLDDYLSQIRQGRQNGFDFNRNKDQKVGKLRTFNKDIKKQLDQQRK